MFNILYRCATGHFRDVQRRLPPNVLCVLLVPQLRVLANCRNPFYANVAVNPLRAPAAPVLELILMSAIGSLAE
jgi:hypothetical protein